MTSALAPLLFGFAVSLLLVPVCRLVAFRVNCVARPQADRWARQPTPLLGGGAIAGAVMLGTLVFGIGREMVLLVVAGGFMFVVGVADDLRNLKPSTKLIAAIAAASLLVFYGYRLQWSDSLTIDTLLTIAWLVGITNAFNLLDNMDGLSAGVAVIAGSVLLAGSGTIDPAHAIYLGLLLGALAGFLIYNFNPASIFMGDSGSLFVGLVLATLALGSTTAEHRSSVFSIVVAPVLLLLIPIFDTAFVTAMRLLSGRRPSQGGRDHSSHRLVAIGLSERAAVAVLWGLAALGGAVAYFSTHVSIAWSGLTAALLLLAMALFAVYLGSVRVYDESDLRLLRSGRVTPFVADFMHKRRVAEVILDVCLVAIAYYAAYRLRFDDKELQLYFGNFLESLPVVVGAQMVAFFIVGVYRGVWRHFAFMDGVVAAKGVLAGAVGVQLILLYLFRFGTYSRGVFVIYGALLLVLLTASRASFRLISEFVRRRRRTGERLVIYGAGAGGVIAVRELLGSDSAKYRMLGFADDDDAKHRTRIEGYPVLTGYDGLVSLIRGGAVDRVVLSTHRVDAARRADLERVCLEYGVSLSRLTVHLEHLVAVS